MSIVLNRVALKGVAWILGIGGMLAAGQAAFASGTGGIGTEDRNLLENRVFVEGHPDLKWRVEAIRAMEKGRKREAFELFKRAASYADKPSQAMVAEMYWTGTGALRNRPLAYAWMDLAAERGYTKYLARREYIWSQLSEQERQEALDVGRSVYAEYADDVAKPRHATEMRRYRNSITGSRIGAVGSLGVVTEQTQSLGVGPGSSRVFSPMSVAPGAVPGEVVFNRRYWSPDSYWAWQDELMGNEAPELAQSRR